MKEVSARANGRVILTGEYSITYGKTALAFPIQKFTNCSIIETNVSNISINLESFFLERIFIHENINVLGFEIEKRYSKFLNGEISKEEVLTDIFDLAIHVLYSFSNQFKIEISNIKVCVNSEIEVGIGFGSSAAFIISILKALVCYYDIHIIDEEFLKLGALSGKLTYGAFYELDLAAAYYGEVIKYRKGFPLRILSSKNNDLKFFIVNSGKPDCHSSECIDFVKNFSNDENLWFEFDKIALTVEEDIVNNATSKSLSDCIRDNNKLLCKIGVVPGKVQDFIFEVESLGGVAKISGSGAIKGEKVGTILVSLNDEDTLKNLCKKYGYNFCGRL